MHQVQLGIHLSLPDDLVEIANRLGVFRLWQAMGLESEITHNAWRARSIASSRYSTTWPKPGCLVPSRYGNEEPSGRCHTPPLDRSTT